MNINSIVGFRRMVNWYFTPSNELSCLKGLKLKGKKLIVLEVLIGYLLIRIAPWSYLMPPNFSVILLNLGKQH